MFRPGAHELGIAMATAWCAHICPEAGSSPVVIESCDEKHPTNCTKGAGLEYRCYNPDSVSADHTAYKPGSKHYCSRDEEIRQALFQCVCNGQDKSDHPCGRQSS